MAPVDADPPKTSTESLREALATWDGSLAVALDLRRAARQLPKSRGGPGDCFERALRMAADAYAKAQPPPAERLLKNPDLAHAMGPFLGDPDMGAWPFEAPLSLPDEDAIKWLTLLAPRAVVDPRVLRFVAVMFRARRRPVWIPAARAIGTMAVRDEASRELLRQIVSNAWPAGIPERWTAAGATPRKDVDDSHRRRHALLALCFHCASGGAFEDAGLRSPVTSIASVPLPTGDASDSAVVLLGLRALLEGESTRGAVLDHVVRRVGESLPDEQHDAALRGIAEALAAKPDSGPARQAVEDRLALRRWDQCKGMKRLDVLWSWLDTAAWFQARGDKERVSAMLADARDAERALRWRLGLGSPEDTDAIDAVVARLPVLLDEDIRETTPEPKRVAALAELLILLAQESILPMPWGSVVRRALGAPVAAAMLPGTVKEAARADLALALAKNNDVPAALLRDALLDEAVVLRMASTDNGYVATQVAVQLERLLRLKPSGEDQVRLLWAVLQRNPHVSVFDQLHSVLRGGERETTPLHQVVASVRLLDEHRRAKEPIRSIANGYSRLAESAAALLRAEPREPTATSASGLEESGINPTAAIRQLAKELDHACALSSASRSDVGSPGWLASIRLLLIGEPGQATGLDDWMKWLGIPLDGFDAAWNGFELAMGRVRDARPAVTVEQFQELDASLHCLGSYVRRLAWPESKIVQETLGRIDAWMTEAREDARASRVVSERLEQLLSRGDEEGVLRLAHSPKLDLLPPSDVRRIGRFLLDHLQYRAAWQLRKRVTGKVQIPSVWSYLTPLFAGVSSGTLLVLDVGTEWNALLQAPGGLAWTEYLVTVCLTLLLSLALLSGSVGGRLASISGSLPRRMLRTVGRVMPTYLAAYALAAVVSYVVLLTLRGTGVCREAPTLAQVVLWASLSLFLGVFLGLILQGKEAVSRD